MTKQYHYHIYQNLFKYLKYREKKVPTQLSEIEFNEDLDSDNLIIITADDMIIILPRLGGKYAVLGADGKRKMKDIAAKQKIKEILYLCDINYVAPKTATSLTTIQKMIQDLNQSYPDVWFQVRPYKIFELVIPESVAAPKHTLVSKEEVQKLIKAEYKQKSSLPQVHEWDPPITWLGGRAGEFVEVERYSAVVGIQKVIRLIVV